MELTEAEEPQPEPGEPRPGVVELVRRLPASHRIAVVAVSAALAIASVVRFGLTGQALVDTVFAATLVLLTAIDLDCRLIPNTIVLPALAFVLAAQIAFYPDQWLEWVLASLGAALFFFLPLLVFPTGMGMGDVKLAALMGAALGKSVAAAIFIALLAGAAVALVLLARHGFGARKRTIAYGPYLALGGIVVMLLGGGH